MRPLHLQARCLWPGDDQEGTCKTRHSPVLSHSHFCFPSACHQAFHFPITYKITKKNYYRKLCNGKGFCRIHNSKSHFFFSAAHQLCAIGTYWRQLSKKICLRFKDKQVFSKLSKGLFFIFFAANGKTQKERVSKKGKAFCPSYTTRVDLVFWKFING